MANLFEAYGLVDPVEVAPEPEKQGTVARVTSDLYKSAKSGILQLPGQLAGLEDIPAALLTGQRPISDAADWIGKKTGFQPGKWAKDIQLSPEAQASQKEIDATWDDKNAGPLDVAAAYLKNPAYSANQVVQSLPEMGVGGALSRLGMKAGTSVASKVGPTLPTGTLERIVGTEWAAPIAGGVGEGAMQAGQQMDQGSELPDQRKNAVAAVGSGLVDAIISGGAGKIANKLGLETAETAMAKGFDRLKVEHPMSAGRRIAGGAASEGILQELPQSIQEQNWQNYAEGKPLMEGALRQGVEGAIAGAVMGAGANVRGAKPSMAAQAFALETQPTTGGPVDTGGSVGQGMGTPGALTPEQADAEARRLDAEAWKPAKVDPLASMEKNANRDLAAQRDFTPPTARSATPRTVLEALQQSSADQFETDRQRVERMRAMGETSAADLIEQQFNSKVSAATIPAELGVLAGTPTVSDLHDRPEFRQSYLSDRTAGITPAEAAARAAITTGFGDIATQMGINQEAQTIIIASVRAKPMAEMSARLQKFIDLSTANGSVPAHPRQGDISAWLDDYRDEAMKAVETGLYAPIQAKQPPAKQAQTATKSVAPDAEPVAKITQPTAPPETGIPASEARPESIATAAIESVAPGQVGSGPKQPWEMTRAEYAQQGGETQSAVELNTVQHNGHHTEVTPSREPSDLESKHRDAVEAAFKRGEKMSPEILKDYPWLAAREAIKPYVANLRNLSDKELKAESKKTESDLNAWANNTPGLVNGRLNPELGQQASFEVSEKMNAVDREIEARKSAPATPVSTQEIPNAKAEETKSQKPRPKTPEPAAVAKPASPGTVAVAPEVAKPKNLREAASAETNPTEQASAPEAVAPVQQDDGADIPPRYFKNVKVDHSVWIIDEKKSETVKIAANDALKSIDEDIDNYTKFLKCLRG